MKISLAMLSLLAVTACSHTDYYQEKLDKRNAVLQCRARLSDAKGTNNKSEQERCEKLVDDYKRTYGVDLDD